MTPTRTPAALLNVTDDTRFVDFSGGTLYLEELNGTTVLLVAEGDEVKYIFDIVQLEQFLSLYIDVATPSEGLHS